MFRRLFACLSRCNKPHHFFHMILISLSGIIGEGALLSPTHNMGAPELWCVTLEHFKEKLDRHWNLISLVSCV